MTQASATERVLDLEIPRERLDKVFQDKIKKYGKTIKVNGFRPGAVPKAVIEAKFREPIAAEALETLVDDAVREACKEQGIDPVGPGRVEKLENEDGKPIKFQAVMEVDPVVELKNYKYEIPVKAAPVDEAAVDAQLDGIRRQIAKEAPVDRAAATGDVVTARYTRIEVAGSEQPLPQYPTFRVEIGKGSVPELDKALLGVKPGDHKDVAFTFPADYANPELAGKPSAYGLAIEQVLSVELPPLDDDFAKLMGYETVADARAKMKERLQESSVRAAREAAWNEAIERLVKEHPLEVPKARVRNYVDNRLKEMGHVHDHDDHGHDHSDIEAEAVNQIRRWRLIEAIATKENVKPDQEAVDARVRELAARYGTDFEGLKASLRKSGRILDIREEVKAEKTLDLVIGYKG
ncbi:MAG TPA: trigger factor [Fibrobacteria bacterium]|jgi:trigger factor|nr:trigger factor [Fibrobacteria bacterium]